MKKLVIAAASLGLVISSSFAQGFFNFDNSVNYSSTSVSPLLPTINPTNSSPIEGGVGQVIGSDSTHATPNYDISYLAMLGTTYSGNANMTAPEFASLGATNGITANFVGHTGDTIDGAGIVGAGTVRPFGTSGAPDGTLCTVQLIAWYDPTGSTTYNQAIETGYNFGWSTPETIRLAAGLDVNIQDISTIPGFTVGLTPEPSIFALSGMGVAALMLVRRRK